MQAAIDIGNTRVKVAFFSGREVIDLIFFDHRDQDRMIREIKAQKVSLAIISSTASESYMLDLPPEIDIINFTLDTALPIEINYEGQIGLDRIADIMALYASNCEVGLAIDIGTCMTFNLLESDRFVGGSISPGLHMRLKAMHTFTGRLPLIEEMNVVDLLANSTKNSLLSGAFHGMRLELDGYLDSFYSRYPEGKAFITGGDAALFAEGLKNPIFADPLLTLRGLNEILLYQAG